MHAELVMLVNAESVLRSRKQLKDINVERWLGWRKLRKSAHDRGDGTGYKAGHFHKPGLWHTQNLGRLWPPCQLYRWTEKHCSHDSPGFSIGLTCLLFGLLFGTYRSYVADCAKIVSLEEAEDIYVGEQSRDAG
jgi:hypothetical protein